VRRAPRAGATAVIQPGGSVVTQTVKSPPGPDRIGLAWFIHRHAPFCLETQLQGSASLEAGTLPAAHRDQCAVPRAPLPPNFSNHANWEGAMSASEDMKIVLPVARKIRVNN